MAYYFMPSFNILAEYSPEVTEASKEKLKKLVADFDIMITEMEVKRAIGIAGDLNEPPLFIDCL